MEFSLVEPGDARFVGAWPAVRVTPYMRGTVHDGITRSALLVGPLSDTAPSVLAFDVPVAPLARGGGKRHAPITWLLRVAAAPAGVAPAVTWGGVAVPLREARAGGVQRLQVRHTRAPRCAPLEHGPVACRAAEPFSATRDATPAPGGYFWLQTTRYVARIQLVEAVPPAAREAVRIRALCHAGRARARRRGATMVAWLLTAAPLWVLVRVLGLVCEY